MTQKNRAIGKYRLAEELASGAFGRVYRAEDTAQKNRVVALKVMHSSHLDSAQACESFLREAQFLKMLEHPYILPILDADIEDEFPFLVTEYAPNGSLHDRLKNQAPRPLSLQEALRVLSQIGQALSYAHQRNIIHRDLKPANILFNADGDALLADFGIATVLATSMRSGTAVGTPVYMAPEQFRGMASKEADQYSLGCIAYELLTGRVPFTAPDFFALGYKHLSEKPLSPSQLNLLVPRSIEDAILTAMAKERGDRHASVDAFMQALGVTSPLTSTSIFVPQSAPAAHLGMPQSRSEWVKALATDGIVKEGSVEDEREGTSEGTGTMRPIHVIAREESGQPFSATASAKRSISFVERDLAAIGTIDTPFVTQQAGASTPYVATPTPAWATTTNTPGSFSSTSKQSRKHRHLYSSKGLVVLASLAAILLVLLSGGIYVLLETPYPATIAAAIQTHDITKLLTLPTAQPKPTSSTVQVLVKTPQTHGNNPTNPNQPTPQPYYALVTITPVTRAASQQFTIDAVLSSPSGSEVQARQITATNQQGFTATATGQGTTAATAATGTVTLSNSTTNSQTVPTGTSISDASNTMNFITQQDVTVPPPVSGQQSGTATVTVQAQTPGLSGDIAANVISETCCTTTGGLYAVNTSAFTGGQDAQTYTYLQQSDIDSAAAPVITSLESSVTASLSSQVRANEQSVGNASCTSTVTPDSPVGSVVTSTNGTVSVTCTQEVYDAQGALSNAASMLQQQETHQGYTLTSQVSTSIVSASVVDSQGTVAIVVNTSATARYVFTTARCQQIAGMIAGKSASQAQTMLKGMTGVASAVISLSSLDGNILPTDISHITVTASS